MLDHAHNHIHDSIGHLLVTHTNHLGGAGVAQAVLQAEKLLISSYEVFHKKNSIPHNTPTINHFSTSIASV